MHAVRQAPEKCTALYSWKNMEQVVWVVALLHTMRCQVTHALLVRWMTGVVHHSDLPRHNEYDTWPLLNMPCP